MKQMGRTRRHYYRIVAIDARQPRDGRVIEELGSYDPHVKNKDERVKLIPSRIKYWQSVGALPSEHVAALLKKFMEREEKREAEAAQAKAVAVKA
ncbi:MAG: 30S ribosomal protein S16 [Planctomycetia bacterium]|nr:30S ribosomal protein S16 [Planctomycetia bacterium]